MRLNTKRFLWYRDVDWSEAALIILIPLYVIFFLCSAALMALAVLSIPMSTYLILVLAIKTHWGLIFLLVIEYPLIGFVRWLVKTLDGIW